MLFMIINIIISREYSSWLVYFALRRNMCYMLARPISSDRGATTSMVYAVTRCERAGHSVVDIIPFVD